MIGIVAVAGLIVTYGFSGSFISSLFVLALPIFGISRWDGWHRVGIALEAVDEMIAFRLPPKDCPDCGQSIFNHADGGGYATEAEIHAIFPSRNCANCGYDLTQIPDGH